MIAIHAMIHAHDSHIQFTLLLHTLHNYILTRKKSRSKFIRPTQILVEYAYDLYIMLITILVYNTNT